MLPQDPYILLSVVNTKLRDDCPCLDDFCAREGVDAADLADNLAVIGYRYSPEQGRFVPC